MTYLADVVVSVDTLALCVVWAIVIGLIIGGIAWLIPPTRQYAFAIGGVVALLVILSCLL